MPARFPNLLANGSAGIAVGMATNIPPHNMRELADGVQWALQHPDASREELLEALMQRIQGPDFPTGARFWGVRVLRICTALVAVLSRCVRWLMSRRSTAVRAWL